MSSVFFSSISIVKHPRLNEGRGLRSDWQAGLVEQKVEAPQCFLFVEAISRKVLAQAVDVWRHQGEWFPHLWLLD